MPSQRYKWLQKNSEKNYLNKEEKKIKIFYEKSQIIQVPRVPMPFKIWSPSTLQYMILWSIKDYKNRLF